MACCAKAPPVLLLHVTLLLAMITGAGLATAARLKWDPSTYIIVRAVFPTEYQVTAVILCTTSVALLALAHLAGTALSVRRLCVRRAILFTYVVLMVALICVEITWVVWMCVRVMRWLQTPLAQEVLNLVEAGIKIERSFQKILMFFGNWHPLPRQIHALIEEVENDIPCNLYVGGAGVALAVMLQPAAVLLALRCTRALRTPKPQAAPAKPLADRCVSTCSFTSDKVKKPALTPGRLKLIIQEGKFVRL